MSDTFLLKKNEAVSAMKFLFLLSTEVVAVVSWIFTASQKGQILPSIGRGRCYHRWNLGPMKSASSFQDLSNILDDERSHVSFAERTSSSKSADDGTSIRRGRKLAKHVQASRHKIVLPTHHPFDETATTTTVLASATYAPSTNEETARTDESNSILDSASDSILGYDDLDDPYASELDSSLRLEKNTYAERIEKASQTTSLGDRIKSMDLQDIISTLIIPSIALFAAGRWAFNRVFKRIGENSDSMLNSFAREMIYHDGDFDEMKLCYQDYSRKLIFLGPTRTDSMLKVYLESYAKKKTVSPQAIVSLSYVFTKLAKLSEERVAAVLVSLCRQMGADKISSAGKLLFLGGRILKTNQGRAALEPIKDLIKGTYRDASVAESLVETSQHAIAEASYRSTVQAGGKNQKSLTPGWETLGLDRETAQRIFDDEAKEGFISAREAMYGLQTQKYDKQGRRISKDDTLEDPDEAAKEAAKEKEQEAVSNVYECLQCGFTLFVAEGRESKFFGADFKCPQCGAPKENFEARDDFGE